MSNQCFIIQVNDNLEVFALNEQKKMLDRVLETLGGSMDQVSRKIAGNVMDNNFIDFASNGGLKTTQFRNEYGNRVHAYLGTSGKKE